MGVYDRRNPQGVEKPGRARGGREPRAVLPPPPPSDASSRRARRGVAAVSYAWSLGYLMSYEGMGRARGSCVGGGGTCGARVFDAHWKRLTSQPHISRLQLKYKFVRGGGGGGAAWVPAASLAVGGVEGVGGAAARCPCVIRLEVLNETSSAGHKWKLVALMSASTRGTALATPSSGRRGTGSCSV